ncbi:MAG TPA: hypothetical protein V6C72_00020, partial [Chroococcales cyanobacterium]
MSLVQKGLLILAVLVAFQIGLFAALYDQHNQLKQNEEKAKNSLLANQAVSNELRSSLLLLNLVRSSVGRKVTDEMLEVCNQNLAELDALKDLYKHEPTKLKAIESARRSSKACIIEFTVAKDKQARGLMTEDESASTFQRIKDKS